MKNNTMAMLAIIAIAMSFASLIGYIEPGTCTIAPAQGLASCEQAAVERLWGFVGLFSFGVITLAVGTIRQKRQAKRDRQLERASDAS
jgi:hypothetical protein